MDVFDVRIGVLGEVIVQKRLQHGQRMLFKAEAHPRGTGQHGQIVSRDVRNAETLQMITEFRDHVNGIDAGDKAVNRFEFNRGIRDIYQFDQRIAHRMIFTHLRRQCGAHVFPALLRRGERVVAVADEKCRRLRKRRDRIQRAQEGIRVCILDRPAANVTRIHHQIKIIQRAQRLTARVQRFDHGLSRIFDQYQRVRKLERRAGANARENRNAIRNRVFRRTNRGSAAGGIIILIQIDCGDDSGTNAGRRFALDENKAVYGGEKIAVV